MRKLDVIPCKMVGEIAFGMSRAEVRSLFGDYSEFYKTQFSKRTTDDFGFCHVYYDENDCCEAVEIFEAEVYIEGKKVFPCSLENIKESFPNAKEEYGSYLDKELSVGIYAPDDKAETILIGKQKYYSD